jgi:hypothetical protein
MTLQKEVMWKIIAAFGVLAVVAFSIFAERETGNHRDFRSGQDRPVWRLYQNDELGFTVRYPADIFTLDKARAKLSHTLANFHLYSEADGSDLGPASDISIAFTRDVASCENYEKSLSEGGSDLRSIAEPFDFGAVHGLAYRLGAEGRGIVYYCVKDTEGKNVFLITREFLDEAYSTELPSQPDYISTVDQEKIFSEVAKSFAFTVSEFAEVQVYFLNERLKPVLNCTEVVATSRRVPKTAKIATAAVNELLKGPSERERADGYTTSIPAGSKLLSLAIANGEARADFNAATESGGGSCSMASRTEQIRQTLLQFPTIKTVRFSIEGRTGDIFQP